MRIALFLLNSIALSAAFSTPCFYGRRATSVHAGLGGKIKNLFGRKQQHDDGAVVVLDQAETTAIETTEKFVEEVLPETKTVVVEEEEELDDTKKMLKQIKDSGVAGVISYALWELGFWTISVPVCAFGYREATGHWPDFQNKEDLEKLGAEAFAFVNFARFAVPLRIGLALGTTPWIQENIVDKFMKKENSDGDAVEMPEKEA